MCCLILKKNKTRVVTIDGYEDVPRDDEKSLKKAVAHQPVSVAIEASGREFQLYKSVIFPTIKPLICLYSYFFFSFSNFFVYVVVFFVRVC